MQSSFFKIKENYQLDLKKEKIKVENLDYQAALAFIHGRTQFKKIPTLERMRDFCERLGNPQKKLKMIHITGTNGKGSTTSFTRQLLMEKGFKVGTFTSPFIIKFNDRICINGEMISDEKLVKLVAKIKPIVAQMDQDWENHGGGPTEFEIDTAIMFEYFAEEKVDYAVIEVGLGGTYDSTNIISPLVTVITNVGTDHLKYLGPTIKDVARNKAGIIKDEVPVIVGQIDDKTANVEIMQTAQAMQAPVFQINHEIQVQKQQTSKWGECFKYRFKDYCFNKLELSLMGDYQISNAALALTAVLELGAREGWEFQKNEINRALQKTNWPGRFEKVNESPLIVLDGAHNIQAMDQLVTLLQQRFKKHKIYIILSILADKQPDEMISKLLSLKNVEVTLTKFNSPRPIADLKEIHAKFPQVNINDQWQNVLVQTVQKMDSNDMILFAGSLYFISEVRSYFTTQEED